MEGGAERQESLPLGIRIVEHERDEARGDLAEGVNVLIRGEEVDMRVELKVGERGEEAAVELSEVVEVVGLLPWGPAHVAISVL